MLIQCFYNLGDQQVEYQIIDRMIFKKSPGLGSGDKVPDIMIISSFRGKLKQIGLTEDLFIRVRIYLGDNEPMFNKGKMINQVCEKGHLHKTLTIEQQVNNRIKPKTRAGAEHVFCFMEQSMRGLDIRSFRLPKATGVLDPINLIYNIIAMNN
jgi:IS5 family transposase